MGLFNKEKIDLKLDKFDYKPGEKIKGTITLNLKKPTKARKLEVALIGKKITQEPGKRGYENVYNFKIPLDGEKEYQVDTYPFEIKVPDDANRPVEKMEKLRDKLAEKTGGMGTYLAARSVKRVHIRIDWYVRAKLDVPAGLDIKKKQQISVANV